MQGGKGDTLESQAREGYRMEKKKPQNRRGRWNIEEENGETEKEKGE